MMKLRMAYLSHLADLRGVAELRSISMDVGIVTIGAMKTQHELITSDALAAAAPILREAPLQIADPQVRYMGTVGGNVANGDPGNDMPGLMQALDAQFTLAGPEGRRTVPARGFCEAAYITGRADPFRGGRRCICRNRWRGGRRHRGNRHHAGRYRSGRGQPQTR
jgi:carbon-monoxide dehydrogenase medium subunit